jgi:hypothetical protein
VEFSDEILVGVLCKMIPGRKYLPFFLEEEDLLVVVSTWYPLQILFLEWVVI